MMWRQVVLLVLASLAAGPFCEAGFDDFVTDMHAVQEYTMLPMPLNNKYAFVDKVPGADGKPIVAPTTFAFEIARLDQPMGTLDDFYVFLNAK
jgi:hypothetical protein